jgi:hypothetical protein
LNDLGDWTTYSEPFFKTEESCHIIEYYSVDELGNTEPIKWQCVYVDTTPPEVWKVHDPEMIYDDQNAELGEFHWMTQEMPIDLYCTDTGAHPVDNVNLWYRTWNDLTGQWSEWIDSIAFESHKRVYFTEDSVHKLQYYCEDALGNSTGTKEHPLEQTYKVDSTPPKISKDMFGNWLGDCPPTEEGDDCFVADNGTSGVNISVVDPDPTGHGCNVDKVECSYEVWWEGQLVDSGEFTESQRIIFNEDSEHTLKISCVDALGNLVEDTETFLVDSTPPETTKTYGDPTIVSGNYRWIGVSTPVTLTATDAKVGVDTINYRVTLLDIPDESCTETCDESGSGDYTSVSGTSTEFNINEESCHLIEFYSKDKLGNTEQIKSQCVFVDNTPPDVNKFIGEPKVVKLTEGQDCNVSGGEPGPGEPPASPYDVGDEVFTITFPEGASTGVGVAFDGEFLYYSYSHTTNLYKIRPDGSGHEVIPITGVSQTALGALSFDATRGKIWAGTNGCDGSGGGPVYLIDPATGIATYMFSIPSAYMYYCFDDGIAYDATDDSIWYSDDVQPRMVHMATNGTFLGVVELSPIDPRLSYNSGIAIGGDNFYLGTDGSEVTLRVHRDTLTLLDEFVNTGFRIEDMECDPNTYSSTNTEVMWIRDAYAGQARAYAIESGTCGLGGKPPEPQCQGDTTTYITKETPITLTCIDQGDHPVDQVSLKYRYRFNDDCEFEGEEGWTNWIDPVGGEIEKTFSFPEDSCHELEYYCADALGNTTTTLTETDIVDSVGPEITTSINGPQIELPCAENPEEDCTFIDGITLIDVNAVDPQPHPVDLVSCDWSYEVIGTDITGGAKGVQVPFIIKFPEESRHALTIICRDGLGNTTRDYEEFIVDKTPPITRKWYGNPFYSENDKEWITSQTKIFLKAIDPEPHPSGVKETFWRVSLVEDRYCESIEVCQTATPEIQKEFDKASPILYGENSDINFTIPEQSCHLIEYYSVDNVDKKEETKKQCVFVDNTGPETVKTVGEPKDEWNGDSTYYPEIADQCWKEPFNLECWTVTLLTPITLDCNDLTPHPVNHSTAFFYVELDGDNMTPQYCDKYEGDFNSNGDGYCELAREQTQFYFGEQSEHNLKYYCEDALGNKGETDDEKFKVEGTSFTIQLNKKWNLISVPFVLINDSPEEVFKDVKENVESIWTFDSFENQWYVYHPNGAPETSNLDSITPGWGYWLRAYNPDELLIGGSLFSPMTTPPSRDVKKGWNLVGYYGADGVEVFDGLDGEGKSAECVFYSLKETVNDIPFNSLWSYWELSNPPNPVITFSADDNLDPGAGYWAFILKDGIYAYTTECGYS